MSNRVKINIFDQEYTISGKESQERILQVAAWVDSKMREIDEAVGGKFSQTYLAVLSSVNIANELFSLKDEFEVSKKIVEQLEGDTQHYIQLWDEAKKNFQDYKDENLAILKQKEDLQDKLYLKEKEVDRIMRGQDSINERVKKIAGEKIKEMEEKYKELENNFFDLQMENVRMKSELEKLRGSI